MFLPYVKAIAEFHTTLRWQVVVGLIQNESAWDPGAVGYSDSDDHGLCQLNAPSQKFTLDESFDPATAIDRLMDIMTRHIAFFGSESDAIAAYNLGRTGAQLWISEGRPQWFIPLSQRSDPNAKPRDVWAYIARIQNAS
jgi:soluble lytic murein transglycosylase-like protein